ncbi:MAG: hypothetical protein V9F06_02035 [Thermomicrobiales bacterium]
MAAKRELGDWIDERQEQFTDVSDQIWERPEVAMAESFACDLQAQTMEADGFRITRNVGDQPTAFSAECGRRVADHRLPGRIRRPAGALAEVAGDQGPGRR